MNKAEKTLRTVVYKQESVLFKLKSEVLPKSTC